MNKKIYVCIAVILIFIVAAGIYVDKHATINVSQLGANGTVALSDYGKAPDFKAGDNWLNSAPLALTDLKGKVVLVDFWTYSCINCIRTLPHVTKWYDTYKDKGLVVIGVHTPEFAFEKDAGNVKSAIAQFGIHYPVVQDNDYGIWNSYQNEYWPAEYLINQQGEIVDKHFGEGDYDKSENAIRQLLGMDLMQSQSTSVDANKVGSPEMYFGTDRLQNLAPSQQSSLVVKNYTLDQNVALNNFSLGGTWQFFGPNISLVQNDGKINLKFHAAKIYMVASSAVPATLLITVDGKAQPSVTVTGAKLYTLFDSQDYSDHIMQIQVTQPGFEAFTFTFG